MNKKLIMVLIATGAMSSSAFAMGPMGEANVGTGQAPADLAVQAPSTGNVKTMREQVKSQIQEMKEQTKTQIGELKSQAKQVREQFKEQIQQTRETMKPDLKEDFKKLGADLKTKLKALWKEYEPQIKELREKFKTATKTEREQIIQQIQALRTKLHSQIAQVASGTDYGQMLQQKWQKIQQLADQRHENVQAIKEKMQQVRDQFKEARTDLVAKFKTVIYQRFQSKIDNMSLARLEKVQQRIEAAKQKFENANMSEETKTKLMSVLAALDEVITEKLAKLQAQQQSVDTDSLLNNLLGN